MHRSIPSHADRLSVRLAAFSAILALAVLAVGSRAAAGASSPAMVKDINGSGGSAPQHLIRVGDRLFFSADGPGGRELWMTDGSQVGTVRLRDIRPGVAGSRPMELTRVGSTLYFTANDGRKGRELWMSDGTPAGTVRVKDIRPGAGSSSPRSLTPYRGKVFFSADDGTVGRELWVSDGTRPGTKLVRDPEPNTGSGASDMVTANGLLFFVAGYSGSPRGGHGYAALFKSDGTEAGTKAVRNAATWPQGLTRAGALLFWYTTPTKDPDQALWRTDGSGPGTKRLAGLALTELADMAGTLIFTADDGINGYELWKSNGTVAGTRMVKDLAPGDDEGYPNSSEPRNITAVGNRAFFSTWARLWVTDGSAGGTTEVSFPNCPTQLAAVGETLYFSGGHLDTGLETCDAEPWTSDGSPLGTIRIADLNATGSSAPREFTNVGGTVYFTADDGVSGRELWRYVP